MIMVIMNYSYAYKPPTYGAYLLFLLLLNSFADLSSSSTLPALTPPSPSPEGSTIPSTERIIGSVGTTAASTFVVAGAFFLCFTCFRAQRREEIGAASGGISQRQALTPAKVEAGSQSELMQFEEIRELIVDEDGLDVLYWKKLKNFNGNIHKEPAVRVNYGIGDWKTSTDPSGRSSSSHGQMLPGQRSDGRISGVALQAPVNYGGGSRPLPFYPASSSTAVLTAPVNYDVGVGGGGQPLPFYPASSSAILTAPVNYGVGFGSGSQPVPFYPASSSSAILTAPAYSSTAVLTAPALAPPAPTPPPPPPPEKKIPPIAAPPAMKAPPPPPPPAPTKKLPPPPPPSAPAKKAPPPPPPPKSGKKTLPGPPKPPSAGSKKSEAVAKVDGSGSGKDQVMLKPLHWEKLNVNPDHSMIWDKIERGSFQYSDDKMEALFGFVPTNRKSAMEENPNNKTDPNAKIFILDPRKSRNTAIVLKSLGIPRSELIDCLLDGKGLSIETLEKLARTVPTREEESEILAFDGDPTKLADAESFLYNILKAVPLAFTRANAMLFRLNYKSEILNVKEPLQVMEPACNELRSHGMFLKLLEAILKAGNRLNAGTARGDAKAFNLTTLLKLSDFKSSDGKTTLLSFVVHEVVRNEGRRSVLTQKNDTDSATQTNDPVDKEEKERELLRLGLPVVSGLSSEFLNVKKAASIDYDAVKNTLSSLKNRLDEIKQLVAKCKSSGGGGGFLKEMEKFLESAEVEMKAIEEEHKRVMESVKKTTQYYQAGTSNDKNSLQLFTIVKDFLGMVDQTCAVIGRSLQTKKASVAAGVMSGSSSTQQDVLKTRVIFPGLKEHFLLANKSNNNSSDSEDEF